MIVYITDICILLHRLGGEGVAWSISKNGSLYLLNFIHITQCDKPVMSFLLLGGVTGSIRSNRWSEPKNSSQLQLIQHGMIKSTLVITAAQARR